MKYNLHTLETDVRSAHLADAISLINTKNNVAVYINYRPKMTASKTVSIRCVAAFAAAVIELS